MGTMKNTHAYDFTTVVDLIICSLWLLLVGHIVIYNGFRSPLMLFYPTLRILTTLLLHRRSRLAAAPLMVLTLMSLILFFDRNSGFILLAEPCIKLLRSGFAFLNMELVAKPDYQNLLIDIFEHSFTINSICCLWLVIIPWGTYIAMLCRKQLKSCRWSILKNIGLCSYILVAALIVSTTFAATGKRALSLAILALLLMPIPAIFNRGNINEMFTRGEVAFLLTSAMFALGYICGVGLELKSAITVCTLPAAFFALMNWYARRETTYRDILPVACASVVFWCAQYATGTVRILMLATSAAMTAIPVIRFAVDTKRRFTSIGLYLVAALILPVFCLGYNPYSVLDAKREWHFDKYSWSQNGILCVSDGRVAGLRDRYGVVLPVKYRLIEVLTPSKPYCKVKENGLWQVYDIERRELVTDEWFEEVIPCGENTYCLKSHDSDRYMTIPHDYSRYAKKQPAVISDEIPATEEEHESPL